MADAPAKPPVLTRMRDMSNVDDFARQTVRWANDIPRQRVLVIDRFRPGTTARLATGFDRIVGVLPLKAFNRTTSTQDTVYGVNWIADRGALEVRSVDPLSAANEYRLTILVLGEI